MPTRCLSWQAPRSPLHPELLYSLTDALGASRIFAGAGWRSTDGYAQFLVRVRVENDAPVIGRNEGPPGPTNGRLPESTVGLAVHVRLRTVANQLLLRKI
jgi:hypothetical protein